jgi:hypothetical protein
MYCPLGLCVLSGRMDSVELSVVFIHHQYINSVNETVVMYDNKNERTSWKFLVCIS